MQAHQSLLRLQSNDSIFCLQSKAAKPGSGGGRAPGDPLSLRTQQSSGNGHQSSPSIKKSWFFMDGQDWGHSKDPVALSMATHSEGKLTPVWLYQEGPLIKSPTRPRLPRRPWLLMIPSVVTQLSLFFPMWHKWHILQGKSWYAPWENIAETFTTSPKLDCRKETDLSWGSPRNWNLLKGSWCYCTSHRYLNKQETTPSLH